MRVKNMMVLGKLCLILVSTNSYAQSWISPINQNWSRSETFLGFAYNISKHFSTRLSKEDSALHTQAVYHALENLDNGELVQWYNDRSDSHGRVRIVYTWQGSGNICRRVFSWVRFAENARNFEDTACYNMNTKTWNFVDKY